MIHIETPGLILREWKEEDIVPFAALNSDPQVMEFFLKSLSQEESSDLYRKIKDEFRMFGYGPYVLERKEDNAFLGFTGFHNISFDVDFAPGVEILWRIRRQDWNKGYVTEAAKACLEYASSNLPFTTVWAFTTVANNRSERVMQKIGMGKAGLFMHPDVPDGHPLKEHVLYKTVLSDPAPQDI